MSHLEVDVAKFSVQLYHASFDISCIGIVQAPHARKGHLSAGPTMTGWSAIRIKSAKELRKNPNAYFYRHVAPHEEQVCTRMQHGFRMA